MDAGWHDAHVLGQGAPMDARIAWHLEHAAACGCRAVPRTVVEELERRGIPVPEREDR
ncbi:hypothetical protein [Cellulomonas biazotea]|uniref:Uncharacterized protein n=1 Tax=Cellulomonas biazotea TaxID=1709 RepID=A0A402DPT1_9CELL|nr:hypothetical protein [Cellulomonas biazotea]GCE76152.1 hypothetical protein CBZ_12080 [Cellulomonas biazotea]